MSKTIVKPTLSLGNHIYLYRLLRDAIGCGKQTFMTQVEEALAAGDMAAYDLGFESTRELLEDLADCIKLTVFKGGRLYATVIANEAWDAALAKGEDKPKTAKGAKQSYKKKKRGEKDLKAVRPKHVKRPEPVVEAVPEPEIEVAIEVTAKPKPKSPPRPIPKSCQTEATAELNEAPKSTTEEAANHPRRLRSKTAMSLAARPRTISRRSRRYRVDAGARDAEASHRSRSSMIPRTPAPASPPWRPPIEAKSSVENENGAG
ncbi:MAG: hypothetical protein ACLTXI_04685 [Collinsella sp.]